MLHVVQGTPQCIWLCKGRRSAYGITVLVVGPWLMWASVYRKQNVSPSIV